MRFATIALPSCHTLKLTTAFVASFTAAAAIAMPPGDTGAGEKKIGSIASMISGLEQRLEEQPGDIKGWLLLGKSYQYMNRIDEAKAAFDKAAKAGYTGDLPDLSGAAATAQASAPSSHHKTAYMNGSLASAITEVTNKTQGASKTQVASKTHAASSDGGASTKAAGQSIKVKVDVSPELKKQLRGNETVFVFAKLPKGMPAPLAVGMKRAGDLPFEIVLDDSKSMMPGHNISSAQEVIIGARISRSGNAMKQTGDIEALSATLPASQQAVTLTLGQ